MRDSTSTAPSEDTPSPIDVEGVPQEEGLNRADVADRVDLDPEEQVNRTDQEPGESIADSDRPEDR